MNRRDFLTSIGTVGCALTCADVFAAQQSRMARIGFLSLSAPPIECCASPECKSLRPEAYQVPRESMTGLSAMCWIELDMQALGWREGENIQFVGRYCYGDRTKLPRLAAELVALRPDVLIAAATIETKALQEATTDIPIVFMMSVIRLAQALSRALHARIRIPQEYRSLRKTYGANG